MYFNNGYVKALWPKQITGFITVISSKKSLLEKKFEVFMEFVVMSFQILVLRMRSVYVMMRTFSLFFL